jgi:hypothetical protein
VQEIETWDDHDEGTAVAISTQMLSGGTVAGLGAYAQVNAALEEALDESLSRDPIFGPPQVHHMFFQPDIGLGVRR